MNKKEIKINFSQLHAFIRKNPCALCTDQDDCVACNKEHVGVNSLPLNINEVQSLGIKVERARI